MYLAYIKSIVFLKDNNNICVLSVSQMSILFPHRNGGFAEEPTRWLRPLRPLRNHLFQHN